MKKHTCYIFLFFVLVGCYTVPETGRVAFNLPLDSMLNQQASLAFEQLKETEKVSTDDAVIQRVRTIGLRIVNAIGPREGVPPSSKWDFVVFDNPKTINAFAMPGGKVAVYTGLFKAVETDEELAFVMGHEIAHVLARHGSERMSEAIALAGAGYSVAKMSENQSEGTQRLIMTAFGMGTQVGIMLPFSRSHESEADQMGMLFMARAGYDPAKALQVWDKMGRAAEGAAPPEWLSTHPANQTRTTQMKGYLPYASSEYRRVMKLNK
jgi:metalloendopeptidase OMA1, mitochondrial